MAAQRTSYAKDLLLSDRWREGLATGAEGKMERPGSRVMPFKTRRLAVPAEGADFPLPDWIPEAWRQRLVQPDAKL